MTISTQSFLSINVGTTANDGTGDDLRTAFIKVNDNFQYMGNISRYIYTIEDSKPHPFIFSLARSAAKN